ncbi:hypothetical protein [Actinoplanes flavus]|uniref:Uncharacterized protein n=1 Tax=Actinoplanes flavus TaxID=2820290 RepID=A0ABS3UR13_9ACTN|nr:hypothetical protein [Actinoplanes flavus]MBO3741220.1 hypothetical protein [Actinoplanes flavus]
MSAPRRAVRPRPRRRLTFGARIARRAGWLDPRRRPGRRFRGYPFGLTPIRRPTLRRLPAGRFRVTVDVGAHPDRPGFPFQRSHRVRSMPPARVGRAGPGAVAPTGASRDPAGPAPAAPGGPPARSGHTRPVGVTQAGPGTVTGDPGRPSHPVRAASALLGEPTELVGHAGAVPASRRFPGGPGHPAGSRDAAPALFGVRADLGAHFDAVRRAPTFGLPAGPVQPGGAGVDGRANPQRPDGDGRRVRPAAPVESRAGFGRVMRWLR